MSVTVKKRDKKAGDARPKAPPPTPEHHPLLALRRDVDKLFDDFFSGFSLGPFAKRSFDFGALSRMEPLFGKTGALAIHVDASETDDEYRVEATFEKGVLRVTMPKREPAKRETKKIKIRSQ